MKVWIETDPQGNTAHHLAAEASNLAVLEVSLTNKLKLIACDHHIIM